MSLFGSGGRKPDDGRKPEEAGRDAGRRPDSRAATSTGPEDAPRKRALAPERNEPGGNPKQAGGHKVASLGKSIVFKGDLTGDEDLEIEGRVEGQVKLPNHQLTIGAHGRVTAQVEAKTVVVVGHVSGNVLASERVEVQASGVVDGDIHAPRLLIQEGAVVNGSIQMGSAGTDKAQPPSDAPRKTGSLA